MRLLPPSATRDASLLLWSRGLRAFGDGFVSIVLPAYLLARGFDALEVGFLATVTLLGSAASTLLIGMLAGRFARKRLLIGLSLLMAATGIAFASLGEFWPLLVVAFVGTLNPSAGDVSPILPLEHAALSETIADKDRTALFARYSLVGSLAGAVGVLSAGMVDLLDERMAALRAMQAMFLLYALIGIAAMLVYRQLSPELDHADRSKSAPLGPSRKVVFRLAALFSLDSFGSGFFIQSLLALWLFDRFGLSVAATAQIFFCMGILSALSYLAAVPIARRIGLVNTMVFTHLPANLCLMAVPFAPTLPVAIALLMGRGLLSQMDVPTRTSYVMAVVTPAERAAAASVTAVPRSLASALSPGLAGWMLTLSGFGWPLVIGGALKIVYDLTLLWMFRHVRPPEERDSRPLPLNREPDAPVPHPRPINHGGRSQAD
jgi:MFS family permease